MFLDHTLEKHQNGEGRGALIGLSSVVCFSNQFPEQMVPVLCQSIQKTAGQATPRCPYGPGNVFDLESIGRLHSSAVPGLISSLSQSCTSDLIHISCEGKDLARGDQVSSMLVPQRHQQTKNRH